MWEVVINGKILEKYGLSYTGSTPALGAGRLGSIPSSPTMNHSLTAFVQVHGAAIASPTIGVFEKIILRHKVQMEDGTHLPAAA